MALSSGKPFYQILISTLHLQFDKRELILIAGILLFMIGLLPFIPLFYVIIFAIGIYFGIKVLVRRRKKSLQLKSEEDYCAKCGEKIIGKKCPNCDSPQP